MKNYLYILIIIILTILLISCNPKEVFAPLDTISSFEIDASRLPNLEYFEFTNSQLTEFPIFIKEKQNIDVINIAYNSISYIPIEESINILIIAAGNQIINTDNKNIIIGSGDDVYFLLPEKYRQYVR